MGGHVASATPMAALANPVRWANRFFCVYFCKLRAIIYLVAMPLWHHSEKSLALVKLYLLHIIIVYSSFIDTKLALFDFL